MSDKELTLEESFAMLDELIEKMQGEDLPLEETFALYKKGVELVESCSKKIEKVEADIKLVSAVDAQDQ